MCSLKNNQISAFRRNLVCMQYAQSWGVFNFLKIQHLRRLMVISGYVLYQGKKDIEKSLRSTLLGKNCCLFILWANNQYFFNSPPPKTFEWFQAFQEANIQYAAFFNVLYPKVLSPIFWTLNDFLVESWLGPSGRFENCSGRSKNVRKLLRDPFFVFIFWVVFIFSSYQKFMSVAHFSQAKKSWCGIAQPSSCSACDNVPKEQ